MKSDSSTKVAKRAVSVALVTARISPASRKSCVSRTSMAEFARGH